MSDGYHPEIRHYYGDRVRFAFLAAAVLSFVSIPFWGLILPIGLTLQVAGGLALVLLAGLTNPHSRAVLILDAIAAGAGALLIEVTAINYRHIDPLALLIVREIEVVLLVLAFYYSVKTVRAMYQHKVGKLDLPWDFEEKKDVEP